MKKLLKSEVCGFCEQCMGPTMCTKKSTITAIKKKEEEGNADVGSAKHTHRLVCNFVYIHRYI